MFVLNICMCKCGNASEVVYFNSTGMGYDDTTTATGGFGPGNIVQFE